MTDGTTLRPGHGSPSGGHGVGTSGGRTSKRVGRCSRAAGGSREATLGTSDDLLGIGKQVPPPSDRSPLTVVWLRPSAGCTLRRSGRGVGGDKWSKPGGVWRRRAPNCTRSRKSCTPFNNDCNNSKPSLPPLQDALPMTNHHRLPACAVRGSARRPLQLPTKRHRSGVVRPAALPATPQPDSTMGYPNHTRYKQGPHDGLRRTSATSFPPTATNKGAANGRC